ncbi:unnamed protein product, partial [Hapterophycus canaliculatus]
MYPDCGGPSSAASDESTCIEDWLGDGICDDSQNNAGCRYDGGDCCECTCFDGSHFPCGSNGFDCLDPSCLDPVLVAEFPDCTGGWLLVGDGDCDEDLNNASCGYDGGD